ncbi:uncharacterized protein [Henckelia pumila]|uniref:uncharacterized protein n=1 Tax=Henckelia pumila TaxID=405737 RepID=UPI003C6DEA5F
MYRQFVKTNQRSKEIKVKHVWQICLFLGVCFWLIYQVKPSHDEKKGFDESDVQVSLPSGHSEMIFVKLGRKGIHSRLEEMSVEDVEENKHEEDGLEDKKDEENESGGVDGGDETFDDAEVDQENSVVGEREGEEVVENENIEEKDPADIDDQMEKESSVEETDHNGDDESSHEAREEHYKADDASSAVSHETRVAGMENENEQIEDILEHGLEENASEETDEGEKRKELEVVEAGEMVKDDAEPNVTYNENEENMWSNDSNPRSETKEAESEYVPEILTLDTFSEDLNLQGTGLEKANYSTLNVDDNHLDSELTGTYETKISKSEGTENLEEIRQDSIDSSDSSEEKGAEDVGADLDTLPEIHTEDTNNEDAAAA